MLSHESEFVFTLGRIYLIYCRIYNLYGKKRPDCAKHVLSRPPSVSPEGRFCVFSGKSQVDKAWMKPRASQPQNHSPCPRASVLTGRRPTERHAPRAAWVLRVPGTPYPLAHARTQVSYRQNKVSIRRQSAIMRQEHHPLLPRLCDKHTVKRIIMEQWEHRHP